MRPCPFRRLHPAFDAAARENRGIIRCDDFHPAGARVTGTHPIGPQERCPIVPADPAVWANCHHPHLVRTTPSICADVIFGRDNGRFHRSALRSALRTLDQFIVRWAQRKYKRLKGHTKRAWDWLRRLQARQPNPFAHWLMESQVGR